MAVYLNNAFSLSMIEGSRALIEVRKITKDEVVSILGNSFSNIIGHSDTANIVANDLGIPNTAERKTISLGKGDILIVAQYIGPRLPEGTTKLPEGAKIEYFVVTIQ